ncbi:MAG: HtaA domain-containing protein [Gordonia sp. (in: high G+C Gram-positive bacteria)]|uniref:HtaA domain-containing protein n=1 Tax=Gordonia sp. (in: high G+C Gram-positive bacteria) TaxID=84139 RepID=UPI003C765206
MNKLSRLIVTLVSGLMAVALTAVAVAPATAKPWKPAITVYLADGVTPVGTTVLHPGDVVVVKGTGFDPNANTSGGFPVPVPPGVPHGTFVTFGAFSPNWRPSQGAPESSRTTVRAQTKWALSRDALNRVPNVPFDMRRTVRQQWTPVSRAGEFTARISLATPKELPANGRWGIYTFGAADAVNAAQELRVPLNYSTENGPNTPTPAPKNLIWAYSPSFADTVKNTTSGGLSGSDGAAIDSNGRMSFKLVGNSLSNGKGQLRYQGTVVAFTKFHLLEIALADPVITVNGTRAVLSMRTSTTDQNGNDVLRRVNIADLTLTAAQAARLAKGEDVSGIAAAFRQGITPTSLAALSLGNAAPVTLDF